MDEKSRTLQHADTDRSLRRTGSTRPVPPLLHIVREGNEKDLQVWFAQTPESMIAKKINEEKALLLAAENGHEKIVSELLDHGADDTIRSEDGESLVHVSARLEREGLLKTLLDRGVAVDLPDRQGGTALLRSVESRQLNIIEVLLSKADWRQRDTNRRTLLHAAALNGDIEAAKLVLSVSSQPGQRLARSRTLGVEEGAVGFKNDSAVSFINIKGSSGETALLEAARFGYPEMVGLLIGNGADPDLKDNGGWTSLHWAAEKGYPDVVESLLLSRESLLDEPSNNGRTALFRTCGIAKDINLSTPMDRSQDTRDRKVEVARILLERDAAVNLKADQGRTPLFRAARYDFVEVAALLIEKGANIMEKDDEGDTAIIEAAKYDSAAVARILLAKGAIDQTQSQTYRKAIRVAAKRDAAQVVEVLLEYDGCTTETDFLTKTVMKIAEKEKSNHVISLLQKKGVPLVTSGIPIPALRRPGQRLFDRTSRSQARPSSTTLVSPEERSSMDAGKPHGRPLPRPPSGDQDCGFGLLGFFADFYLQDKSLDKAIIDQPTVHDLIYGRGPNEVGKAIRTVDLEKPRDFRWLHLPANNIRWVEDLMTRIYLERDPIERQGYYMDKCDYILDTGLWVREQHLEPRPSQVHARFIRPFCQARLINQDSSNLGLDKNLVLSLPFLHWETDDARVKLQGAIKEAANAEMNKPPPPLEDILPQAVPTRGRKKVQTASRISPYWDSNPLTTESALASARRRSQRPGEAEDGASGHESGQSRSRSRHRGPIERSKELNEAKLFKILSALPCSTEEKLIRAYLFQDNALHVRRTLDQFYYYTLKSTEIRDASQVLSRYTEDKEVLGNRLIIMVHQLWLWVLDDDTVVTCFPPREDQRLDNDPDPGDNSDVLERIRRHLSRDDRLPINNVHELAEIIVRECLSLTLEKSGSIKENLRFLECFESAIETVMDSEVELFKDFSDLSSYLGPGQEISKEQLDWLFNIHEETKLLIEIKDIMDELHILEYLLNEQKTTLEEFDKINKAMTGLSTQPPIERPDRQSKDTGELETLEAWHALALPESKLAMPFGNWPHSSLLDMVRRRKKDFEKLEKQASAVKDSIKDLLELRQKQANVSEARAERHGAEESAHQGETIMLFTIVTVFFAPLSFLTSFFALKINAFRVDKDGAFTLSYILEIIFPAAIIFTVILLLWAFGPSFLWRQPLSWIGDLFFTPIYLTQSVMNAFRKKQQQPNPPAPEPSQHRRRSRVPSTPSSSLANQKSFQARKREWTTAVKGRFARKPEETVPQQLFRYPTDPLPAVNGTKPQPSFRPSDPAPVPPTITGPILHVSSAPAVLLTEASQSTKREDEATIVDLAGSWASTRPEEGTPPDIDLDRPISAGTN